MKEPAVDTWVIVQLIASISIFGFSVGGLIIRGHRTVYDTVRAVFATLYLIWAIADASVRVIYRCIWTFKPVKLREEENQDDTYEIRNSIQHNNTPEAASELAETSVDGRVLVKMRAEENGHTNTKSNSSIQENNSLMATCGSDVEASVGAPTLRLAIL